MILVDSCIWIDHFRDPDPTLNALLNAERILCHSFIIGEIALGSFKQRPLIIKRLRGLEPAVESSDHEVFTLIETTSLFGSGIGFIDAHLIASTRLTPGASLWTRDRRLLQASTRLGIAWDQDRHH